LKFKDLKFGRETFKQVTHGNISTDMPQCINDFHVLMLMGFLFLLLEVESFCFCFWRLKAFVFALGG
jgi:hypothetical protein